MKFRYSLTFEHHIKPPLTAKGEVEAGGVHTALARAVKDAKKQLKGKKIYWGSMVVWIEKVSSNDAMTPISEQE